MAHFFNENHGRILIKHLIDGDHLAHLHQNLDDFGGLHAHLVREIGNGNRLRHAHLTHHGFRGHLLHALLVMVLLAAAASPVVISRVIAAAGLDRAALLTFVIPAAVVVAFALAALAALLGSSLRSPEAAFAGLASVFSSLQPAWRQRPFFPHPCGRSYRRGRPLPLKRSWA